jgi:hypothetical protein
MTEPGGDHGRVGSLFDEERHVGVAHVMEPARLTDRGVHGRFPEPGAEAGAPDGSCGGCGEDQVVAPGVGGEVFGEDVDQPGRDGYGAAGGSGFGFSEGEVSVDFGEGAFDADGPFQGLVVLTGEAGEFPESGSAVRCGEHQGPEPGMNGVGEVLDFGGGEVPLFGWFDLGQLDTLTR